MFRTHGCRHGVDARFHQLDLAFRADQRDHDLGHHRIAILGRLDRGFKDRAGLHVIDLGNRDAQTDAAHSEHGVVFRERLNATFHR